MDRTGKNCFTFYISKTISFLILSTGYGHVRWGGGSEAWLEAGSCPELQVITAKYHREAITRHGTGRGGGRVLSCHGGEKVPVPSCHLKRGRGGGVLSFSGGERSYPVVSWGINCVLFCNYEGVLSFPVKNGKGSSSFLGAGIMSLLDLKRGKLLSSY
jgi:hypothetical protein